MNPTDLSLHGLIGGSGSNIKSIQRGTVDLTSNTANVTINSVNLNNAIVKVSYRVVPFSAGNETPNQSRCRARISDATTLQLTRGINLGTLKIAWEVIEFNNVKSLQKGDITTNSTEQLITINAINAAKSTIFFSALSTNEFEGSVFFQDKYRIVSNTQIGIEAMSTLFGHWFVIEFN